MNGKKLRILNDTSAKNVYEESPISLLLIFYDFHFFPKFDRGRHQGIKPPGKGGGFILPFSFLAVLRQNDINDRKISQKISN